jgi:hypothetical protein
MCVLTLRHDDFSPAWSILTSSSASQLSKAPPNVTVMHRACGRQLGGSFWCVIPN